MSACTSRSTAAAAPILCIHGAGSSALAWSDAIAELARLGRVIAYDRRGCTRSERPEPYERTSVAEHADDAAGLLDALEAAPAVVIGRSYGATVATDLALRYPDRVRALVLLEGDAPRELAPATAEWGDRLGRSPARGGGAGRRRRGRRGADRRGAGKGRLALAPEELRRLITDNGPAILAEVQGEWWLQADAAALATIDQPALLVAATDSRPELREPTEALASVLPNARTVLVGGGHLIDPAGPEILAFVEDVLARPARSRRGAPSPRPAASGGAHPTCAPNSSARRVAISVTAKPV